MPLYEYECEACGHRFEVIRRFSDPPLEECTACGGKVRKLLSSPAIQFKGSGWYITDYARKGSTGSIDSTGSGSSGSDSRSTGSSSESTSSPAKPPDSKPPDGTKSSS
jgi:putative FmdB family regulatory protein